MVVRIVGETGLRELPAGRVVDLPYRKAKRLVEQGYAVPVRDLQAVERRSGARARPSTGPRA